MNKSKAVAAGQRVDNLDLMKAVGILMVLSLHVPLWNYDFFESPTVGRVIQYAFRLVSEGVPLFMFVNGFLLFRKSEFDLKKHLMKALRMFALLLVWCVILTVAGLRLEPEPQPVTLQSLLYHIFWTQVGSQYTGAYWFLQNMLAVYLMYPVLRAVWDRRDRLFEYMFAAVFAFTVGLGTIGLVRDYASAYCDVNLLSEGLNFLYRFSPVTNGPVGTGWYLFYFLLGGMVLKHQETIRRRRALFSLLGLLSWAGALAYAYTLSRKVGWLYNPAFNYGSITMTLFLVGFFALTIPYRNRGNLAQRFIAGVGKNTLGIYLTHFLFIFVANRYYIRDTAPKRAIAFVAVFLLSHGFSMLIRKIPGLRRLMSMG